MRERIVNPPEPAERKSHKGYVEDDIRDVHAKSEIEVIDACVGDALVPEALDGMTGEDGGQHLFQRVLLVAIGHSLACGDGYVPLQNPKAALFRQ